MKYISDKFETKYEELVEEGDGFEEDRDEYEAEKYLLGTKRSKMGLFKDNAKRP